ncbi:LPD23 domain-containing protein [Rhodovulum sp. PH10]|uniref:LPD23 domain-containing protein n=1 Tax=Rhodovulum sp. PH10 TaxID=1187851 RepID=UPI0012FB12E5|nr:LPD23 domain-containing protein [Rhodovulum sp. PH10]
MALGEIGRSRSLLEKLGETWPVRAAQAAYRAVTLPGDVYAGRTAPDSPEAIERSADLAGILALGGTGAAAAGVTPRGAIGVFGGPGAKTADHAALAEAKRLAAGGAPMPEVYKATGWYEDPATKAWRFFIPDDAMTVTPASGITHPDLVDAYPIIGRIPTEVRIGDAKMGQSGGHFVPSRYPEGSDLYVHANGVDAARESAAHELQHAIQYYEGALPDRTGGPEQAAEMLRTLHPAMSEKEARAAAGDAYRSLASEVEARNAGRWALMPSEERAKTWPGATIDRPAEQQITQYTPETLRRSVDAERAAWADAQRMVDEMRAENEAKSSRRRRR